MLLISRPFILMSSCLFGTFLHSATSLVSQSKPLATVRNTFFQLFNYKLTVGSRQELGKSDLHVTPGPGT